VRNVADGRVELFADGPEETVELFLADIRDRMRDSIRTEEAFEREPDEGLSGFRIEH
jgi:acylphosphatase